MKIGELRTRLRYQTRSEAATPGAGQTVTWTDSDYVQCRLEPEPGGEQLVAGGVQAVKRWLVTMRWRSDVVEKNRFTRETDGLVLNIVAVENPDGRQLALLAHCASKL